jgi:heme/copper-type cytochrome/quinol oxidase subunit 2
MRTSFSLVIVVSLVAVIAVASVLVLSYAGYFKPGPTGPTVHITIYEEDPPAPLAGMNGSYNEFTKGVSQWPVIHVHQNETVIISIINVHSSEVHGFAIDYYDPAGVTTAPGQQNTVKFYTSKLGTFRIYCNVVCAIHPTMQNGELIVSS